MGTDRQDGDGLSPGEDSPRTIRSEALRMLGKLAEVGMDLALGLREQAALELARGMQAQTAWTPPGAGPAQPPKSGIDIGLQFSRISRAVRLTLAMRVRLADGPAPEAAGKARQRRWSTIGKKMLIQ